LSNDDPPPPIRENAEARTPPTPDSAQLPPLSAGEHAELERLRRQVRTQARSARRSRHRIRSACSAHLIILVVELQSAVTPLLAGGPTLSAALPSLSGPLTSGITDFIHTDAQKVVTSSAFASLWADINRTAHAAAVQALTGRAPTHSSASDPSLDTAHQSRSANQRWAVMTLAAL